jgi:hypothetical protein
MMFVTRGGSCYGLAAGVLATVAVGRLLKLVDLKFSGTTT